MNVKTAQVALIVSRRDQIAADVQRFRAEGLPELAGAATAILTIVDNVLAPALEGTPAPGQLRAVPDLEEG